MDETMKVHAEWHIRHIRVHTRTRSTFNDLGSIISAGVKN